MSDDRDRLNPILADNLQTILGLSIVPIASDQSNEAQTDYLQNTEQGIQSSIPNTSNNPQQDVQNSIKRVDSLSERMSSKSQEETQSQQERGSKSDWSWSGMDSPDKSNIQAGPGLGYHKFCLFHSSHETRKYTSL